MCPNKLKFPFYLMLLLFTLAYSINIEAQNSPKKYKYGTINPLAPKQVEDYAPIIGKCNCKSVSRNQDGLWGDTVLMTWTFRYIMDGMAVQDETIKDDGRHSGSIRQYNPDSSKWYVHYYSSAAAPGTLPAWEGGTNENGNIVLYNKQKAPNGTEGFFKITFSDMTNKGFNWVGEWVNINETFSYQTWKIFCQKEK
jgi:hypothetical protein